MANKTTKTVTTVTTTQQAEVDVNGQPTGKTVTTTTTTTTKAAAPKKKKKPTSQLAKDAKKAKKIINLFK